MSSIHYTNAVLTIIALALSVIAVENIVRPSHYTNAVLTIIALVLSVIAVENILRPSAAQSSSLQPVAICDIVNHNCLDVTRDLRGSFERQRGEVKGDKGA
jgi:hypothetical protein